MILIPFGNIFWIGFELSKKQKIAKVPSTSAQLMDSGVEVSTLANGLKIVTETMPGFASTSIGVYVGCGARHETPKSNGISHLLEHMAFKGTTSRSARAIAEEIEAVGGHLNAYTSREQTAYYARVLKNDVELAVDILSDILIHSTIDKTELKREQEVILQEIGEAEDTPDDIIFDHFQEKAYPNQALGRPVLGTRELVSGFKPKSVKDYLAKHYGADRMILAAAGGIDHQQLRQLAEEKFSALPQVKAEKFEAARYVGGEYREERDLEQVHLVLGLEACSYVDPDFYASQVFSTLFGGGMSSRLFQEIRETRGLAYSVYSFVTPFADTGILGIYAGTGADQAAELIPAVCGELKKLADHLPPEAEVARARAQLKASLLMALESSSHRSEQLARQWMIFGRPLTTDEIIAEVDAVDNIAITRVAERFLTQSSLTMASLGPIQSVPEIAQVQAMLR